MTPDDPDRFSGTLPEDEPRVARLMAPAPTPETGLYVDAFGVRVDPSYCNWVTAGTVGTEPPFPHGYHGDAIEYAAAALALESAAGRTAFTAVELGAGWGPWTTFIARCAERAGFATINLAAFEADRARFAVLERHLAINGITADRFNVRPVCAAAWWRDETLHWPVTANALDAGLAPVSGWRRPRHDYRGLPLDFEKVQGRAIASVLKDFPPIDFLHVDIQGGEWELISRSLDFLSARVRTMFVGTHSRKIEGDLIALLRDNQWQLMRERPCRFRTALPRAATLAAETYHDGGQFWRNEREIAAKPR